MTSRWPQDASWPAALVAAAVVMGACRSESEPLESAIAPEPTPKALTTQSRELIPERAPVAAATPGVERPGASAVIVWGRDATGRSASFWVEQKPAGEFSRERSPGIVLAAAERLWRFATRTAPLAAELECAWLAPSEREAVGVRAELREVGQNDVLNVLKPEATEALESAEWRESVWLEGSIGPYLFVHRAIYGYFCGAHGMTSHEFTVYDATKRQHTPLYREKDLAAVRRVLEPKALDVLQRGEQPLFTDELEPTLYRPVFEAGGALRFEHQFTARSCYACSDERWNSYTVSARILSDKLPHGLQNHGQQARAAVHFIQQDSPGFEIAGFSLPDPEMKQAFIDLRATRGPVDMRPGPSYPKRP